MFAIRGSRSGRRKIYGKGAARLLLGLLHLKSTHTMRDLSFRLRSRFRFRS